MPNVRRKTAQENTRRKNAMPYITSEMRAVLDGVRRDIEDEEILKSIHFSPTALTQVRHVMVSGGLIVSDTSLTMSEIKRDTLAKLKPSLVCYLDDRGVIDMATQRRVTRAEVAMDHALGMPGLKLFVVGSAPMALARLLQYAKDSTPNDIVIVAAPSGFASVIQLKEAVWESGIPCIVVRGKKGGANVAAAITNALMEEMLRQMNP